MRGIWFAAGVASKLTFSACGQVQGVRLLENRLTEWPPVPKTNSQVVATYFSNNVSFRCNVDYRGAVTNVRIGRNMA